MRRSAKFLIAAAIAATGILPAAPAHAMTCQINDDVVTDNLTGTPDPGDTACAVFLTAVSPVCSKFGCG